MEMYLLTDVATAILFQMKMFDYSDVTILQYKKFLIRLISLAHANGKDIFDAELRKLRKENERLKMENEILKKAAAYFAKHPADE